MLEALGSCQQLHKSTLRTLCNALLKPDRKQTKVEEELQSLSYWRR